MSICPKRKGIYVIIYEKEKRFKEFIDPMIFMSRLH